MSLSAFACGGRARKSGYSHQMIPAPLLIGSCARLKRQCHKEWRKTGIASLSPGLLPALVLAIPTQGLAQLSNGAWQRHTTLQTLAHPGARVFNLILVGHLFIPPRMSSQPSRSPSLRRFLVWPLREKQAFAFAFVALPMAELSVRMLGSKSARKLFDRKVSAAPNGPRIDPRRADQIVKLAAEYTIGNEKKCLRRSLVLARILRANGLPVEVHIGFRKDDSGALVGHAWCDMTDETGKPQSPEGSGYVRFE